MEPSIRCPYLSASGVVLFRVDQESQMRNSFSNSIELSPLAGTLRNSKSTKCRSKTNIDQSLYHDHCSPCTGSDTNGNGLQSVSLRKFHLQQSKSTFQQRKSQAIDENPPKNQMKTKARDYIRQHSPNASINHLCILLKDTLSFSQTTRKGFGREQIGSSYGIQLVLHSRRSPHSNSGRSKCTQVCSQQGGEQTGQNANTWNHSMGKHESGTQRTEGRNI